MFRRLPTTRNLYDFYAIAMFLDVFISLSSNLGLMILRLIGVYRPLPYFFGGGRAAVLVCVSDRITQLVFTCL